MNKIVIDKNIPFEGKNISNGWPLEEMEVGDSFLLENSDINSVSPAVSRLNKRYDPKGFKPKSVIGGIRIWRVK